MQVKLIVDDGFARMDMGFCDIEKAIKTLKFLAKKEK